MSTISLPAMGNVLIIVYKNSVLYLPRKHECFRSGTGEATGFVEDSCRPFQQVFRQTEPYENTCLITHRSHRASSPTGQLNYTAMTTLCSN